MRKLLAFVLALFLLLTAAAFAEEGEAADTAVRCDIENGSYVIRIPDADGDLGWVADDMAQDDSVVKLASAELVDGEFVVQYDPVGDGEIAVQVKHYTGIACDEVYSWDLRVEGGAVVENAGGSYSAVSDDAEYDAYLSGEWEDLGDTAAEMTVARNETRGWDVVIAMPATHGAYIFKTTIYADCDVDGFVYDKGKFWEAPITDSEEETDLGEAAVAGTAGVFRFSGDEENLSLTWYDDQTPDREVVFVPANADVTITARDFEGEWVGSLADGDVGVIIASDGENCAVSMQFSREDYTRNYAMDFTARFDPETQSLVSEENTVMREIIYDEYYNVTDEVVVYENGVSDFAFNEDGALIWTDHSDDPYEAVELVRPFGWIDPEYVGPGHHFVGDWNEERVSAMITERMDGYDVIVSGSNGASSGTAWLYSCVYDEATDSLVSDGETAMKVDYAFDENGDYQEDIVYEDGEAVFTIDEEGRLIWDDKKENAGEDRAFERAAEMDVEPVTIDYGDSEAYSIPEMDEAIACIDAEFSGWEGCEMHAIRYAGDDWLTQENLAYVNSLREDKNYVECIVFLTDFHSPVEGGGAWEADQEYTDYQWWLAREAEGGWELLTWGY